jgi:deferrochelatase/peroxidase EfeB
VARRGVKLTPPEPSPIGRLLASWVDLIAVPLIILALTPFVILFFPLIAIRLRQLERANPVIAPRPTVGRIEMLSRYEQRDITNPFSAMGSIQPSVFRRWLSSYLLWLIDWAGRHITTKGKLSRVRTIHCARWIYLDDKRRLYFASDYDGSHEAYMDDFVNKVAFGLNLSFSHGIGIPKTRWLLWGGASNEGDWKSFLRHHEMPTPVWYKGYPGLTCQDLARNARLRKGLERDDIQAIVRAGFGRPKGSRLLLIKVRDGQAGKAREWLRKARDDVLSVADFDDAYEKKVEIKRVLQIAISAPGLTALELPDSILTTFPADFQAGIASDDRRSQRLGDVGANSPAHWKYGAKGDEPHLLLMLYAHCDDIDAFAAETRKGLDQICEVLHPPLDCSDPGIEPFGFTDGVSQPRIDWDGKRTPGGTADQVYTNWVSAGEVVLGYLDEYNLVSDRPLVPASLPGAEGLPPSIDDPDRRDLGRNGSFLVLRTLRQDDDGFWNWARENGGEDGAQKLAEAVIGRRMDGKPLDGLGTAHITGLNDPEDNFTYDLDPEGHVCPFGGHIRRANPRTGDIPGGGRGLLHYLLVTLGLWGTVRDDVIAPTRYHRLLRRGRPFGRKGEAQGLHFIALNSNITRHFEFIQNAWLMNPSFAGLANEADPLTGCREPHPPGIATDNFTRPTAEGPCTRYTGLPRFVTVEGGGYFFLPGLRALDYIARAQP